MPEPVVDPLEPEDSALRHPPLKPVEVNTNLISGHNKPDIEGKIKYSAVDYWNMALPFIREKILNKMMGVATVGFSTVFHWVIILMVIGLLLYGLFRSGIL